MNELEQKLKDLKVRIFDGAEALENALKEKAQVFEVLVKIAKAVGFDPDKEQVTYDQIVDKVVAAAAALKDSSDDSAKADTAAPVASTVAEETPVADPVETSVTTAETPVQ